MDTFLLNGRTWRVTFVNPNSLLLVDRRNSHTLATTDPYAHQVYISNALSGDLLRRVLAHELGHCVMVSYDMLPYLHKMTRKEYWVDMEEWVCNFLAEFSPIVHTILMDILRG